MSCTCSSLYALTNAGDGSKYCFQLVVNNRVGVWPRETTEIINRMTNCGCVGTMKFTVVSGAYNMRENTAACRLESQWFKPNSAAMRKM